MSTPGPNELTTDEIDEIARLFEHSQIGFGLTNLDGKPLHINRAGRMLILGGVTADEVTRMQTVQDVTHPDDREASREAMRRLRSGESDFERLEKRNLGRDGVVRWADFFSTLMRDGEGRPRAWLTIAVDITERKRAEDELRAAHHVAQQAVAGKDELLSRITHELRTPLTAVIGLAELLVDDSGLSAKQRDCAEAIVQACDKLCRLVDDLGRAGKDEPMRVERS